MRLFPGALQKYWWRPANKWKPRTSSWRLHSEFRTASQARTVPVALSAEPARPCRVHAPRLCGANREEVSGSLSSGWAESLRRCNIIYPGTRLARWAEIGRASCREVGIVAVADGSSRE